MTKEELTVTSVLPDKTHWTGTDGSCSQDAQRSPSTPRSEQCPERWPQTNGRPGGGIKMDLHPATCSSTGRRHISLKMVSKFDEEARKRSGRPPTGDYLMVQSDPTDNCQGLKKPTTDHVIDKLKAS